MAKPSLWRRLIQIGCGVIEKAPSELLFSLGVMAFCAYAKRNWVHGPLLEDGSLTTGGVAFSSNPFGYVALYTDVAAVWFVLSLSTAGFFVIYICMVFNACRVLLMREASRGTQRASA